ncbi:MAG: porin family protein [Devosiaceae bacterium]|nr:porin family protein [Devosiaceae bacterium MH13]
MSKTVYPAALIVPLLALPTLPSVANAADPVPSVIPFEDVEHRWTGAYVGAHVGYGTIETTDSLVGTVDGTDGWAFGFMAGYSYQHNYLVFGVEADFSVAGIEEDRRPLGLFETKSDYFGSIRGRIGAAFGDLHAYVTAGGGLGNVQLTSVSGATSDTNQAALVYGAGIEWALNQDWAVGIEALRYDVLEDDYVVNTSFTADGTLDVIRARFSYTF